MIDRALSGAIVIASVVLIGLDDNRVRMFCALLIVALAVASLMRSGGYGRSK